MDRRWHGAVGSCHESAPVSDAHDLLDEVIARYLGSGDFNGLFIRNDGPRQYAGAAEELVRQGLLQVVSERDYPNPHIRPWPSRHGIDAQLEDLQQATAGKSYGVCLYPTPLAMEGRPEPVGLADKPYCRALAEGRGHLELAFFSLDVIEPYRNDPRYHFTYADFEVSFGIADEAYLNESEPPRDKVGSVRAGFAYDGQTLSTNDVRRYVCTFLSDLAELTPEHQRRWESYETDVPGTVFAHPIWWAMMMGNWPDGIGPFDKVLAELTAINDLWELIWNEQLFATCERPRDWGWILRPSTGAWHEFILTTDKLLSDNIRHDALNAAGAPRRDKSDQPLGSLARLERLLVKAARVNPADAVAVLGPMRSVRKERQQPAHRLGAPTTDSEAAARQRDLLADLGGSLEAIRELLMRHPKAVGWQLPTVLTVKLYRL